MGNPKEPEVGDVVIDASDFSLRDLNIKQVLQAGKIRDGFEKALTAFRLASPEFLKRIKVDPDQLAKVLKTYEHRKRLLGFVAPIKKLLELVEETIVANGSEISTFITDSTKTARDQAQREAEGKAERAPDAEDIEATLEDAFNYQYGPGQQGAQTRASNIKPEEPKA